MSTYGLKTFDASGNVLLDISDTVARIRYSNVVAADASGSVELTDISGKTFYLFSIQAEYHKCAHTVSVSGTTFSWTPNSVSGTITVPSGISLIGVMITD